MPEDKLKTLKDIEFFNNIDKIELKAEAIKWVKEGAGSKVWDGYSIADIIIIKVWIKTFFNITEDDLK